MFNYGSELKYQTKVHVSQAENVGLPLGSLEVEGKFLKS
jgi:hypothetical protein